MAVMASVYQPLNQYIFLGDIDQSAGNGNWLAIGAGVSNRPSIGQGACVPGHPNASVGTQPVDNPTNGEDIQYAQPPISGALSALVALLQHLVNDKLADMQKVMHLTQRVKDR